MPTETKYKRHDFTNSELLKISQEMAEAASKKKANEDRMKSVQSSIKADINLQDAALNKCAEQIRSGYEERRHDCNVVYNHDDKTVDYFDVETIELIEHRPMTHEEQLKLA